MEGYEIGKQVVCVNDTWQNIKIGEQKIAKNYPVMNGVYTIRDIYSFWDDGDVGISILLEEIINPQLNGEYLRDVGINCPDVVEPSFLWYHFRPAKKTDISEFTSLLKDVPKVKDKPVLVNTDELV